MSTLSDLLPAGSGGKNVNFVASGSLPNGQTVGLKSDGTVEAIAGTSAYISSPVVFDANGQASDPPAIFFDPDSNKVVLAYTDFNSGGQSGYGTCIVGTVTGTTITFSSTPLIIATYATNRFCSAYDPDTQRGVVGYLRGDSNNYGIEVVVLTGIGTTLQKGGTGTGNNSQWDYSNWISQLYHNELQYVCE